MPKIVQIGPVGWPWHSGEISCSKILIFLVSGFWFLAKFWRTHFWEYRRRFCTERRVSAGIDFLAGSHLNYQNLPSNFRRISPIKKFSSVLNDPESSSEHHKSCIVSRQILVGDSKYAVIFGPLQPDHVTAPAQCAIWPFTQGKYRPGLT